MLAFWAKTDFCTEFDVEEFGFFKKQLKNFNVPYLNAKFQKESNENIQIKCVQYRKMNGKRMEAK